MSAHAGGKFITIEGGEGAGKSTQVKLLAGRLDGLGIDVLTTREPGGAEGAETIRRLLVDGDPDRWTPMTEALLHFAARKDHLANTILPALDAGRWVVSDRFADSTMAYQGHAQGLGEEIIRGLYEIVVGSFAPDLTLILDLAAETGLARASTRGADGAPAEDRYERMGIDFHHRLRDGFLAIANKEPGRCRMIDGSGDMDAVAAAVWDAVAQRFGLNR